MRGWRGRRSWALFNWLKGRKKTGGLPAQHYLAVTPTRVLAVSFKARPRGLVADEVLREWDRATTRIEVEDRPPDAHAEPSGARVTIHPGGEERPVELESMDRGYDVNDAVLDLLRG